MYQNQAKILIVDDNIQNLFAIKTLLEELSQPIICADSAAEALKYVLYHDFAVILLDVHLPDINGFETARLIRAREKSSYTPIIFLSAQYKEEIDVGKGYAMGAVDYIFKPIDPSTLLSKVKVFVDLFTKSTLAVKLKNELQERRRAEQRAQKQKRQLELANLERIKTIEEMSSALAHELNQPLTTIANYVKGCVHRLNSGEYDIKQLINALQRASQQTERAGAILHRIKNFVGRSKLYLELVSINELINNISTLLPDEAEMENIQLLIILDKQSPPQMLLDKIQIEQVLLNLLRNSIDMLKDCRHPKPLLIIETKLKNKRTLIIQVKDNGLGIAADISGKLFDLYFTTKKNGMGVGLSICRTIIEAHDGRISAANNPQGGACFQITLPIRTKNEGEFV